MALSLAIVVGVTDYQDESLRLPACVNDVEAMGELLRGAGKFNEVFVVPSDDGKATKNRIARERQAARPVSDNYFGRSTG
ncbi:caspase family protein [Caballeronia sp. ATUFL_M1_KS5A]|uniref:caspase family protein n=1 Tax=Caballeronia sp. ATUFL_M1_KS5A TaxID=2921778 RepID=UPI0032EDC4AF